MSGAPVLQLLPNIHALFTLTGYTEERGAAARGAGQKGVLYEMLGKGVFRLFPAGGCGTLLYSWLCPEPKEEYIVLEQYGEF